MSSETSPFDRTDTITFPDRWRGKTMQEYATYREKFDKERET